MPIGRVLLQGLESNRWLPNQRVALQASWWPCQPGWDPAAATLPLLASRYPPPWCLWPHPSCPSALICWPLAWWVPRWRHLTHWATTAADTSHSCCLCLPLPTAPLQPLLQLGILKGKGCQFLFYNISGAPFWGFWSVLALKDPGHGPGVGRSTGPIMASRRPWPAPKNPGGTRVAL